MAAGLMTVKVAIKVKSNITIFGNGKRTDYITIFILKISSAILRQLKSIGQLVGQRRGTFRQVIGDGKVVGKANRAAILDSQVKILELAVILYLILRAVNLNCDVCDPVIVQRGSKTRRRKCGRQRTEKAAKMRRTSCGTAENMLYCFA